MLSLFSFAIAIVLLQLVLPLFSQISGVELGIHFPDHIWMLLGFVGLAILTGLVAGSYPALYLSAFRPIRVLKGRFSNSLSAVTLRKALVVFQFMISAVLIIAAITIGKQMNYMRNKDLGFSKDNQVIIPLRSENAKNISASLKNELIRNGNVLGVGSSLYYPGIFNPSDMNFYSGSKTVSDAVNLKMNWADNSFLQTLDMKPVAGRLFSEQFPADTNYRIIVNETAAMKLGYPEPNKAIGEPIFLKILVKKTILKRFIRIQFSPGRFHTADNS